MTESAEREQQRVERFDTLQAERGFELEHRYRVATTSSTMMICRWAATMTTRRASIASSMNSKRVYLTPLYSCSIKHSLFTVLHKTWWQRQSPLLALAHYIGATAQSVYHVIQIGAGGAMITKML